MRSGPPVHSMRPSSPPSGAVTLPATWMPAAGRSLAKASALSSRRRRRGNHRSFRTAMCSPVTSNGPVPTVGAIGRDLPPRGPRPSPRRTWIMSGFASSNRSSATTEAAGFTVPASYFVKARGPPPNSLPASTCERPRSVRMARISSGEIPDLFSFIVDLKGVVHE